MAQHILEAVISAGILSLDGAGAKPEDARAYGICTSAKLMGRTHTGDINAIWAKCESPLETTMAAALCYAAWPCKVKIEPQYKIGNYRLDFLVTGRKKKINVECDGEAFHHHDITMAQYQADRARDRFVEEQGITVKRYRGADIWVDAIGRADEVATLLLNLIGGYGRGGL